MNSKLFCNPAALRPAISRIVLRSVPLAFLFLGCSLSVRAGDAPQWMHALVNAPLPKVDEKTDAVLLYSAGLKHPDRRRSRGPS